MNVYNYDGIMQWLTKAGEEEQLRNVIDLKRKVKATLEKFSRLNLLYTDPPQVSEDSQEEVVKGKETINKSHAEWTFGFDTSSTLPADIECDPTTPEAQLAQLKRTISRNRYTLFTCL